MRRVLAHLSLLLSALAFAAPASATGLGAQNSPPFSIYLGAGFYPDTSGSTGLSGANSPAFAINLSRYQDGGGTLGVHGANSSAFAVYLGQGYAPLPTGPFSSGRNSSQFALQLAKLREAIAHSDAFTLDARTFQSPGIPPPFGLTATKDPVCGTSVELRWNYGTESITGFELESKIADAPGAVFVRMLVLDPEDRGCLTQPTDGLRRTYRIRALQNQAASAYSEQVIGPDISSVGTLRAPASVYAKSIGDGTGILVHVMPPGTAQWDGTSRVEVQQFTHSDWSPTHLVHTEIKTFPSGTSDGTVRFTGDRGTHYWFRARALKPCTFPSSYTNDVGPVQPDHAPVLLVHGIYGDASDWNRDGIWPNALSSIAGLSAERVRAVDFTQCGGTWVTWGRELAKSIFPALVDQEAGRWPRDERIDIIAYSQGGLAARYLIERSPEARKRVRSLVMIATPNHGGNFSTASTILNRAGFSFGFCGFLANGPGVLALRTNSPELRWLNFGAQDQSDGDCTTSPLEQINERRGAVDYYTIAGTGPTALPLLAALCPGPIRAACAWRLLRGEAGSCDGDGVVKASSVRLRALEASHQFRDVDIGAGGTAHIGLPLAVPGMSTAIMQSQAVAAKACSLLRRPSRQDEVTTDFESSRVEPTREDPALIASNRETVLAAPHFAVVDSLPGGLSLVAAYTDSLDGNAEASYGVDADPAEGLMVLVTWADSLLTLRLRGPDSTLYSPADTATHPWLHFANDTLLGFSSISVDSPQVGRWSAEVHAPPNVTSSEFLVEWFAIGADHRITGSLSTDAPAPGDTVYFNASLRRGGALLAGGFVAEVGTPSSETMSVALTDDGAGGDLSAGDGVYTGLYRVPAVGGLYPVTIRATVPGEGGGPEVQRTARQSFSVTAGPDVEILSTGLSVAPEVTAVGRLTELSVCVANRGFTGTDSTRIVVWDESTHDTLGVTYVSIPAKDSTSARLLWTPTLSGVHTVQVTAEVEDATELDPENNTASLVVPVAAIPATAGVDTIAVAPAEFSFAPPRPNPFRGHLTLEFTTPRAARVAIEVFDVLGRRVRRVLDGIVQPGRHTQVWKGDDNDGRSLPAGVYLVRFVSPGLKTTKRTVLIR